MFTKSDLRNGMIVETNESRYIIIDNTLCNVDGFMKLDEYDENLLVIDTDNYDEEDYDVYDIMKVYSNTNFYGFKYMLSFEFKSKLNCIFDRTKEREKTEELKTNYEQALAELTAWRKKYLK